MKPKTLPAQQFILSRSMLKDVEDHNLQRLKVQLATGCFDLAATLAQVPKTMKAVAVEFNPQTGDMVVFARERT